MDERGWIYDRFLASERELGGFAERLRAAEHSDALLRSEMREGFTRMERAQAETAASIAKSIETENAHTRGEIARLDDLHARNRAADEARAEAHRKEAEAASTRRSEEMQKQHDLIVANLKAALTEAERSAKEVQRANRRIIAGVVIAGIFAQQIIENLPSILRLLEQVIQ